jgi:cytochrome c oxidase subunit 3
MLAAVFAEQFEDMARQAQAARLGVWVFVGSEMLFFAGLFTLYAAYRVEHPGGFDEGVATNTIAWGSTNTLVLLVSSYVLTLAVRELRRGRNAASARLVGVTMVLGTAFALIKVGEWMKHFSEGLYPGGVGRFYTEHDEAGTKMFYTLYYCMTGLHEVHIVVGVGILGVLLWRVATGRITAAAPHALELGSVYWHFVDVVWLFLWPMFYLVPGAAAK